MRPVFIHIVSLKPNHCAPSRLLAMLSTAFWKLTRTLFVKELGIMPHEPIVSQEGSATAKVVADSIYAGSRLVSVEVEFPRAYLAEFNTHRMFSRNSASSRAIPVWKRMKMALDRPYIPNSFGKNKAGMQAADDLGEADRARMLGNWLAGRDVALIQSYCLTGSRKEIEKTTKGNPEAMVLCERMEREIMPNYPDIARAMSALDEGLHKQHANRPLELYSFHTVIVTSSYWRNFFGLRPSMNAQPEAQDFGIAIARAIMRSVPQTLLLDEWHLPYVRPEDLVEEKNLLTLARISCARCARTSYLTHDGIRSHAADLELVAGLQTNGHMSPFEHAATPNVYGQNEISGNFSEKWIQYRKFLENENDYLKHTSPEDLLLGCRGDETLRDFILAYAE